MARGSLSLKSSCAKAVRSSPSCACAGKKGSNQSNQGQAEIAGRDRLARSTRDLLNTLAAIAEAGATFKSLGDAWAETTTPHGRLMLTVLGGLAEFDRQRAQQRGVRFGKKPKLNAHQQEALARRCW